MVYRSEGRDELARASLLPHQGGYYCGRGDALLVAHRSKPNAQPLRKTSMHEVMPLLELLIDVDLLASFRANQ